MGRMGCERRNSPEVRQSPLSHIGIVANRLILSGAAFREQVSGAIFAEPLLKHAVGKGGV